MQLNQSQINYKLSEIRKHLAEKNGWFQKKEDVEKAEPAPTPKTLEDYEKLDPYYEEHKGESMYFVEDEGGPTEMFYENALFKKLEGRDDDPIPF